MNLEGIRILVTRAKEQASLFSKLLKSYGATVLLCPTIKIVPPRRWAPIDSAIKNLSNYHWLIFTSVNGVEKLSERVKNRSVFMKDVNNLKTCAIGPMTAQRMKSCGIRVDMVSKNYVAESILDEIHVRRGDRILIPRAALARDILPETLRQRGALVTVVESYRTVMDRSKVRSLKDWIRFNEIDCVTFTSSSTVRNFFALLTLEEKRDLIHNHKILAASIGPITTQTLKDYGWQVRIHAAKPTTQDLAEAILKHYGK